MRRVGLLHAFGLCLALLALSACVQSARPLLIDMRAATPLPAEFVIVNVEGTPEANRFDRVGETYVAVENGVKTTYRLVQMPDLVGQTGPFYIAVETSERDKGANYGLIELSGDVIVLHSFDSEAIGAELRLATDKFGIEVETDQQLLDIFQRVASDAAKGGTKAVRFRVLDLADPARRVEAERVLEETRKAREAAQ